MTRTPLSRSKGQGHQAALLSAALTHTAAAAVSVGTYSAWESTATLCLLGGAGALHEERGGAYHIVSPRAQLVILKSAMNTVPLDQLARNKGSDRAFGASSSSYLRLLGPRPQLRDRIRDPCVAFAGTNYSAIPTEATR